MPVTTDRRLTRKQRDEELAFLARRARQAGSIDFTSARETGVSSNALVAYALGLAPEPTEREYPGDLDDLRSCLNAFISAPRHLRPVMVPMLRKYAEHVMEKLGEWYPMEGQS